MAGVLLLVSDSHRDNVSENSYGGRDKSVSRTASYAIIFAATHIYKLLVGCEDLL